MFPLSTSLRSVQEVESGLALHLLTLSLVGYGSLALQAEKRPSELRMKKRFKEMSKMLKQTSTPTSNIDRELTSS